jgi:hypothetical protein
MLCYNVVTSRFDNDLKIPVQSNKTNSKKIDLHIAFINRRLYLN